MQGNIYLMRKLKDVPKRQISKFIDNINDLSVATIYNLNDMDTNLIRLKCGVFSGGQTVPTKDLASKYNVSKNDMEKYINNIFNNLKSVLIEIDYQELLKKVEYLETKRKFLSSIGMSPEDYIEVCELHLDEKIVKLLKSLNIVTIKHLCNCSIFDLLRNNYINIEIISIIDKQLNKIGYCLNHDYSMYSYDDLKTMYPNMYKDIQKYIHSLGICLKNEDFTDTLSIDVLGLSIRPLKVLKMHDIDCLGDLRNIPEEEMAKFRNLGSKSIVEIYDKLNQFNDNYDDESNEYKIYYKGGK